jgi:hypothetical protein
VLVTIAVMSTVVALGVKETAVVIPALAFGVVWASPQGITRVQRLTLVAMSSAAAVYAVYRLSSGILSDYARGVSQYFLKQLVVEPFATLAEPWSAAWMRLHPGLAFTRGAAIITLIAAASWSWRRGDAVFRRALVLGGWVLISVLPVFSFFHVSATLEGSRYVYLPAAGFSMLLATLMAELARRATRGFASLVVGALVVVLAGPAALAIRPEVARWLEAGRTRDAILESYVDLMSSARCRSVVTEGRADNVDGAYVLRNGFSQAIARRASLAYDGGQPAYNCRISWTDHLIVRQE